MNSPTTSWHLGRTLAGFALAGASCLALADTSTSAFAQVTGTHFAPLQTFASDSGATGLPSASEAAHAADGTVYSGAAPYPAVGTQRASASSRASATEGALRAELSAGVETTGIVYNSTSARSTATAAWFDYLTIRPDTPVANQTGHLTARMNVSGTASGGAGPGADYAVGVRLRGSGMARDFARCGGWSYCIVQSVNHGLGAAAPVDIDTMPDVVLLDIPIVFSGGKATVLLDFGIDLYATAGATTFATGNPTSAASAADFMHTFAWGGITGVTLADGSALTGFTHSSVSGFDYLAVPVPEPETWAMFLAGLAALGWRRARSA
ncbi:MAG: PEP-CTERM sorting domain-containing protein [Rhodocyclaceae bacterium]|nr:PEP-CTERM sorting domain-containing protein [Rhodocyclaceae bacterium]